MKADSALREIFERALRETSGLPEQIAAAFAEFFDDQVPDSLAGAFLVALKTKGETADEIAACAMAMRARAKPLRLEPMAKLVDTAGTGGDGQGTFNISTGAALVAAAAGVPVAKHGNRAASGRVGGADVLEAMGVRIECDESALQRCLDEAGICFVFAPAYHPAMARFAPLRRTLGIRTIFNLVGPLANPAAPRRQIVGVPERGLVKQMARAMSQLGVDHALVVHGVEGMDEISPICETVLAEVRDKSVECLSLHPEFFGMMREGKRRQMAAQDRESAVAMLREALSGDRWGLAQDALALNGGAAIYVGGKTKSLADGIAMAREVIEKGLALETIERLRRASNGEAGTDASAK